MMERLRNGLAIVRGQLWIVPVLMSAAAVGLAAALLHGRFEAIAWVEQPGGWLFSGDADTARNLLGALLSGLITMTSLVVSITFVILTLASNQLGPRLVLNFIADRQIQAVLGLFIGTTLYLVVVLRSFDGGQGAGNVPNVAVTTGSLLTATCLIALLFYVHKIARAVIADTQVAQIAARLGNSIGELPSTEPDKPAPRSEQGINIATLPRERVAIAIGRAGYIQTIDYESLVAIGRKEKVVMTVPVRAGHFVLERGEHVIVHSSAKALEPKAAADIVAAFVIGSERSPAQDLEYSIRQLVEVALRALSPSLNDPFTAIAVVDRLGAALQELLQRELPARMLFDKSGDLRVIASRSDFAGLIEVSFAQIRQSAMQHPSVLIHMADTIGKLAPTISGGAGRAALRDQLELLRQTAEASTVTAGDRNAVLKRIDDALASEAFGCIAPRSPGDTARRAVPVT